MVTGLGFGDEGKGTTVEYLARRHNASLVIRHNGGAQAGHNIVTDDGVHHTFSQFGCGTFDGVRTYLSRHMVVHPGGLLVEANTLAKKGVTDPLGLVVVDPDAPVITPFHTAMNRIRELARGAGRHGTCGIGVGETVSDSYDYPELVVHVGDLLGDPMTLRAKLLKTRDLKVAEAEKLIDTGGPVSTDMLSELGALTYFDLSTYLWDLRTFTKSVRISDGAFLRNVLSDDNATVVFEGAQGTLLDEWWGAHPHTTYSDCTPTNALGLLRDNGFDGNIVKWGVLRTYMTRHGQGPLPTEDTAARRVEPHNSPKTWQGAFRWGDFDAVLSRYAVGACRGQDALSLTHLDGVERWRPCVAYDTPTGRVTDLPLNHNKVVNGYQPQLLGTLQSATPVYDDTFVKPTATDVAKTISDMVGVPVGLMSYGPTYGDKKVG